MSVQPSTTTLPGASGAGRAVYGLFRGTQAALSVAPLLLAALLADDRPPPGRLALALVAGGAGVLAMFAAHDLLDLRHDRRRHDLVATPGTRDLDAAGARHPVAQGRLGVPTAIALTLGLGGLALAIATALNPVCAALLLLAALLQAGYCALAAVTPWKALLSGAMIGVSAPAGWFAITTRPDWPLLALLVSWLAAWEIGGRNLPNDLADVAEDTRLGLRTVPVVHGTRASVALIEGCLALTTLTGAALMVAAWPTAGPVGLAGTLLAGVLGLQLPARRLRRRPSQRAALALFTGASLYPAAVLAAVLLGSTTWPLPGA
ncbi:UbiA family prenyltransferase [Streptomyces millisiae]|uniref:UbiA family prenyltransferase n=1 Tax=Streptomyces millisiae TaxID=3075542 RepID=A0ABU2LJ39_9ACTN|nr:UbiA family prenyltransferase [Streptomyces sp. DSM 44918]MDT0317590.1 UbiA family prenyltransferase [Streptomyces sp. DSM 44918]